MIDGIINAIRVRAEIYRQHYRTRDMPPAVGQLWAGKKKTLIAICDITQESSTRPSAVVFTKGVPKRGIDAQSYEVPLAGWGEFVRTSRIALIGTWEL